jgi:hypothetical protein
VAALVGAGHNTAMRRAAQALLAYQRADGGWGARGSTAEETAYGVLALRALRRDRDDDPAVRQALERAEQWLLGDYRPFKRSMHPCWQAKEIYRPYRLARMIELVATFPSAELAAPLRFAQSVGGASSEFLTEPAAAAQGVTLAIG